MLDAKKCLEIYDFCQMEYGKMEKRDGHYNPKHDKVVMNIAAKKFKLSDIIINKAFDLAAQTKLKKNMSEEKSERYIRNKLIAGLI